MELQAILDGIESACKKHIRQIEADAQAQVEEINRTARLEAAEQENRIISDGRARLNREKSLIEQQALVRSLQIHADARQVLIEEVLEKVKLEISRTRERQDYPHILNQLVSESLMALRPSLLEDQKVIVHFDPADKSAAAVCLKNAPMTLETKFDITCAGGCEAESADRMVIVKNTLESRFEHAHADLQQKLSIFFEEKSRAG